MPQIEAVVTVPLDPEAAFALAFETGEQRAGWDPAVVASRWVRGATGPEQDATMFTRSPRGRRRLLRIEHLVPGVLASLRLVRGDALLADYGEGLRFTATEPADDGSPRTRVTWKVIFKVRSRIAARAIGEVVQPVYERELDARIAGYAEAADARARVGSASRADVTRIADSDGRTGTTERADTAADQAAGR